MYIIRSKNRCRKTSHGSRTTAANTVVTAAAASQIVVYCFRRFIFFLFLPLPPYELVYSRVSRAVSTTTKHTRRRRNYIVRACACVFIVFLVRFFIFRKRFLDVSSFILWTDPVGHRLLRVCARARVNAVRLFFDTRNIFQRPEQYNIARIVTRLRVRGLHGRFVCTSFFRE